jgi:hypothetical protein
VDVAVKGNKPHFKSVLRKNGAAEGGEDEGKKKICFHVFD